MHIYKINQKDYKKFFINDIGTQRNGASIMEKKTKIHTLMIKNIHVGGANILKQDALSIGADLAVPIGAILAKKKYIDVVLIGTTKHLEKLSKKELSQPFGLKYLSKLLKQFTTSKQNKIEIMGVINTNDDSFFKKSRFKNINAIKQIHKMIKNGATIIDIGAVSSRPGSCKIDKHNELKRVKLICNIIKKDNLYKLVKFSIDSYTPKVVEYALKSGFKIVNDITGLRNNKIARLVSKYNATVVIMHMKGSPLTMQLNPSYEDIIIEVDSFLKKQIKKAKSYKIKKIVLDVGIGFGKTLKHNLILLNNLEHFKHFGYEILIGASRKSMIDNIIPTKIENRLAGTLAIHLKAIDNGASIIRCHDVKEHNQAIKIQQAILNI
jgi:dihydropteroate synthase